MSTNTVAGTIAKRNEEPQKAKALVAQYRNDFAEVLPSHIKPATWIRLAQGALKKGKLAKDDAYGRTELEVAACNNPGAFLAALLEAARLGLEPGTDLYYLTPRRNKKNQGRLEILGIVGYQGHIELMYNAGAIASVVAEVVHEKDIFRFRPGADEIPHHEIDWDAEDRGPLRLVYAFARMKDGATSKVIVLNRSAIAKIRAVSPAAAYEDSIWDKWESSMWLKGLALDTPVPTPTGWTTMAHLLPGDEVFDMYGSRCQVSATSAIKHLDCYRVTFANGTSIVCDAEHLWMARIGRWAASAHGVDAWGIHEISELYAAKTAGQSIVMPVSGSLDIPDADLPIDPWVLGFWLGDGNRTCPAVTCNIDNQHEVIAAIGAAGYQVSAVLRDQRSRGVSVRIRGGLGKQLAEAGLIGHKHVPLAYMRGSARQRLALLRGLVDADGGMGNVRGRAYFYNTDLGLATSVAELARSLGEMVNIIATPCFGFGKHVIAHRVSWQPTVAPATLSAKLARFRPRTYAPYRSVCSIDRVPSVPTRCIAVDSPTRTYLAGTDMTPTHNSAVRQLQKWVPTSAELRNRTQSAPEAVQGLPEPTALGVALATSEAGPVMDITDTWVEVGDGVVDGEVVEAAPGITERQSKRLDAILTEGGINRETKLALLTHLTRRANPDRAEITSSAELTETEAAMVIKELAELAKFTVPLVEAVVELIDRPAGDAS